MNHGKPLDILMYRDHFVKASMNSSAKISTHKIMSRYEGKKHLNFINR